MNRPSLKSLDAQFASDAQLTGRGPDRGVPRLLMIGVDHRSAAIEMRERVAYGEEDGQELLLRLVATEEIAEASLLSTCNRTELYLLPTREEAPAYRLGLRLAFLERAPEIESEGRFFVKRDQEAAKHLYEVASGLQSMILGEPEILGQVKRCAARTADLGTGGVVLQQLMSRAIDAAGRVRRNTAIGAGAVSFGFSVVDLARNIFRNLEKCSVLLLGAGETSSQVARSFYESGAGRLVVANRGRQRAEALREVVPEIEILPFEGRFRMLRDVDVVVASTAAEEAVLTRQDLVSVVAARRGRPLLLADLGVPRNIDPAVGSLENVFLQDIDSLEGLIAQNLRRRREEIPRVQEILELELERFHLWCKGRAAEPLVRQLQKRAEEIRRAELAVAHKRFPETTHQDLDKLTRALVRKILHHPSLQLRRGDLEEEQLEAARQLFQLDHDEDRAS